MEIIDALGESPNTITPFKDDIYLRGMTHEQIINHISNKSKLTQELSGLPIVSHVYNAAKKISGKNIIVVCNKENYEELKFLLDNCKLIIQKNQKGTADAIETAKPHIKTDNFIVLFGDVPLITDKSLKKLIDSFEKNNSGSMIAFKSSNPKGYGRVILKNNKVEIINFLDSMSIFIISFKFTIIHTSVR